MKKLFLTFVLTILSASAFADRLFIVEGGQFKYYGYSETFKPIKDGWTLMLGVETKQTQLEERLLVGVPFETCHSTSGILKRFNSQTNSWVDMVMVTSSGETIGDVIAKTICIAAEYYKENTKKSQPAPTPNKSKSTEILL